MADYSITAVARRVVYTGSAGVGPYSFSFPVLVENDIAVYQNSTLLTLTTDYTVSITPGTGTGSVTLVVAATGSDTITITGARAIERTTDFVTAGDLLASSLNTELDSQTIFIQQVAEDASRAIQAPVTDPTSIDMTLPLKADRLGKFLSFNSSTGNPEVTVSTADVTGAAASAAAAASSATAAASSASSASSSASTATTKASEASASAAEAAASAASAEITIASQAEAEAGTDNANLMTPLRTKQAVDNYGLLAANNLSDLDNTGTARTNLGLVIGTDVQAFDADTMKSDTATRVTANMGFTPVTDASSSGSVTFDFSTGNISKITLSEDITSVTISGATAGDILHIQITQDSTARAISGWPASVKWSAGGTAPTISTTSGAVDIVSALFDGTNYWASVTQDHQ